MKDQLRQLSKNLRIGQDRIEKLLLATGGQATLLASDTLTLNSLITEALKFSLATNLMLKEIDEKTDMSEYKVVKKKTRKKS